MVVRLHGALIGVLTHLVDRLGRLATEDASIAQVLPPLLAHALDLRNPESDALVEDALKLLRVTLSGCSQLAPQLQASAPSSRHPFGGRLRFPGADTGCSAGAAAPRV